jgi:hypothetical protein
MDQLFTEGGSGKGYGITGGCTDESFVCEVGWLVSTRNGAGNTDAIREEMRLRIL